MWKFSNLSFYISVISQLRNLVLHIHHHQQQHHQALWDVVNRGILRWVEGSGMVFITHLYPHNSSGVSSFGPSSHSQYENLSHYYLFPHPIDAWIWSTLPLLLHSHWASPGKMIWTCTFERILDQWISPIQVMYIVWSNVTGKLSTFSFTEWLDIPFTWVVIRWLQILYFTQAGLSGQLGRLAWFVRVIGQEQWLSRSPELARDYLWCWNNIALALYTNCTLKTSQRGMIRHWISP